MKYRVIKKFRDKETGKLYLKNKEPYETDNKERAAELQEKGFLYKEKAEDDSKGPSVLDQNVDQVKKSVTTEMSQEELDTLLKEEKADKNRKSVVDHLQEMIGEKTTQGEE